MKATLFSPLRLRRFTMPNRFVRSATYEGLATVDGVPLAALGRLYATLGAGGVGTIITGFVYVSPEGRAMQQAQCGMDSDVNIPAWRGVVQEVRRASPGVKLVMQLAHTGRQTLRSVTGRPVLGVSSRRCTYFRQRVRVLDDGEIRDIVKRFASAARRAMNAGFDAVQIHGAHGYLVHQFLSPWTNRRTDRWREPTLFLEETIRAVRRSCGDEFPVLVKLSSSEDNEPGLREENTIRTVERLEAMDVDAVEISYGTMETAFNIMRGAHPVDAVFRVNPLFSGMHPTVRAVWRFFLLGRYLSRLIPFCEDYNVGAAERIRRAVPVPIIPVGGIRSARRMTECIEERGLDAVALCRPLVCEPDLPLRIREGRTAQSACTNCNLCTVYCDTGRPTQCYRASTPG